MTTVLSDAFDFIINMGFLNIVVPFILFYAIVFGMLERTQIFSPDKKKTDERTTNLHSLIAFAIAITATAASHAVGITQNYLPILAVASVVLLGIMMLLGMAFGDRFDEIMKSKTYTRLVWAFAGILIFGALITVTYYVGLFGTPCTADNTLTPVNNLNPSSGQCNQLADFTELPTNLYIIGINVFGLFNSDVALTVVGLLVMFGIFFGAIYLITKKGS